MSFTNFPSPTPVFPTLPPQGWSVHKGPSFHSEEILSVTGREVVVSRQVYPRWEFTLNFGDGTWLRDQTQNTYPYAPNAGYTYLEQISGLFLYCQGAMGEFYFDDPDDDSRAGVFVGYTPALQYAAYPLYYPWGAGPFNPPFTAPVTGINIIDAVYLDGAAVSDYTVDSTNTKLVFLRGHPGSHTITADFHFYSRCRFLADLEEYNQWAENLWENRELKFQSVKP